MTLFSRSTLIVPFLAFAVTTGATTPHPVFSEQAFAPAGTSYANALSQKIRILIRKWTAIYVPRQIPEEEQAAYQRLAQELVGIMTQKLPDGGLLLIEGMEGVGKNMFIEQHLIPALHAKNRAYVHATMDLFKFPASQGIAAEKKATENALAGNVDMRYHEKLYRTDAIEAFFPDVIDYLATSNTLKEKEKTFTVEQAFKHRGSDALEREEITLHQNDLFIVDSGFPLYSDVLQKARCPHLTVRLNASAKRAEEQFMNRSFVKHRRQPLHFFILRAIYYLKVLLPNRRAYEQKHRANIVIHMKGPADGWYIKLIKNPPWKKTSIALAQRIRNMLDTLGTIPEGNFSAKELLIMNAILKGALQFVDIHELTGLPLSGLQSRLRILFPKLQAAA